MQSNGITHDDDGAHPEMKADSTAVFETLFKNSVTLFLPRQTSFENEYRDLSVSPLWHLFHLLKFDTF